MTVLFSDAFADTDGTDLAVHVPDVNPGYGWITHEGIIVINGNKAAPTANTDHVTADMGDCDGTLTADVVCSDAATHRIGIILRYIDFQNCWYVNLGDNATLDLYKVEAGAWTLEDSTAFTPVVGTTYPITVTLDGSDITAVVDGHTVTCTSTFNRAISMHGFRFVGVGTVTKASVDNVVFTSLATTTTRDQANVLVDAYLLNTGLSNAKRTQLADIVKWLIDADLWSHVKHFYITVYGFNKGSGATIYDLVAAGENLTQAGCTWPTVEGQALTKGAAASIASTNALIPIAGAHTVLFGTRFMKAAGQVVLKQDAATPYQFSTTGTTMINSVFSWEPGDGNTYTPDYHDSGTYNLQSLYHDQPVALVNNTASGKIFYYANRFTTSALESAIRADDGVACTPVVPNAAFEMPVGADFDLEYLLILDTAINGFTYQLLTFQIEKALTPRSPASVNSGLMWLDTRGVKIPCSSFGMYYDSITDKYYLYDTAGIFFKGYLPASPDFNGGHYGVECYSSSYINGPWTYEGPALKMNQATFLTGLGATYPSQTLVAWPHVVYHSSRRKYILAGKCQSPGVSPILYMLVLAEADAPTGPFTVTYTGLIDSDEVGDLCIFADSDGTGYVVYSQQTGVSRYLKIVALNASYTAPTGSAVNIKLGCEAPSLIKIGSRYWLLASPMEGWNPGTHSAFYSDAATPMTGWVEIANPFVDTTSLWDTQSFWSQCSGLVATRSGSVIYVGTRQIHYISLTHGMWTSLCLGVVLPVTIAGDAITITWQPHWSSPITHGERKLYSMNTRDTFSVGIRKTAEVND